MSDVRVQSVSEMCH